MKDELLELYEQVYDAITRLYEMEDGDEKIAAAEEAVRLADRTGDVEMQFHARNELLQAAFWGGAPEKSLVAFSWCLSQYDQHPDKFSQRGRNLLWTYKWMTSIVTHFPQISREKIYEMLDDMERRYRRAGYGLRVVHQHRSGIERFWGDRKEAIRQYHISTTLASDDLSNCPACEIDERVSFHLYCGEVERALAEARPLIEGLRTCRTVPHRTLARFLVPLLRLGRREEARRFHLQGYPLVARDKGLLDYVADHLVYLSLAGELDKAAELLSDHCHLAEKCTDFYDRYQFYRAAWLFLDIAAEAGRDTLALNLHASFPLFQEGRAYDPRRLAQWFRQEAAALARKFDARNGNDHISKELEGTPSLKELMSPLT